MYRDRQKQVIGYSMEFVGLTEATWTKSVEPSQYLD